MYLREIILLIFGFFCLLLSSNEEFSSFGNYFSVLFDNASFQKTEKATFKEPKAISSIPQRDERMKKKNGSVIYINIL